MKFCRKNVIYVSDTKWIINISLKVVNPNKEKILGNYFTFLA